MFVRNWIDIIRSKEYLDLIPRNKNRGKIPIVDLSFNDIPIRTSYDLALSGYKAFLTPSWI